MVKYNLRQQDFQMKDKEPIKDIVTLIWVLFTISIITGTIYSVLAFRKWMEIGGESKDPFEKLYGYLGPVGYFIVLVAALLLYMVLKFFITLLFCHATAASSIHMKILEGTAMPVCFCREAFRVWQTLLIYCVPVILVYSLIFYLCVATRDNAVYMAILFFMSFYIAYDLTLVLYVLFYKLIYRMDYIAVDHHVYYFTLYKKPTLI